MVYTDPVADMSFGVGEGVRTIGTGVEVGAAVRTTTAVGSGDGVAEENNGLRFLQDVKRRTEKSNIMNGMAEYLFINRL